MVVAGVAKAYEKFWVTVGGRCSDVLMFKSIEGDCCRGPRTFRVGGISVPYSTLAGALVHGIPPKWVELPCHPVHSPDPILSQASLNRSVIYMFLKCSFWLEFLCSAYYVMYVFGYRLHISLWWARSSKTESRLPVLTSILKPLVKSLIKEELFRIL